MHDAKSRSRVDKRSVHPFLRMLLASALIATATGNGGDKKKLGPEVFAPGIISTDLDELCGSFSPDGKSFYFVRRGAYTTSPPISIDHFRKLVPAHVWVRYIRIEEESMPWIAP